MAIRPRTLGSAASVPMTACDATICSVAFATSSTDRNSRPLRSKNGPPSGRRTLRRRSARAASRSVSVAAARSAASGVAPSITTAIRSVFCGNATSKAALRSRHGTFDEISLALSVSIATLRTTWSTATIASTSATATTPTGCRALPTAVATIARRTGPIGSGGAAGRGEAVGKRRPGQSADDREALFVMTGLRDRRAERGGMIKEASRGIRGAP